MDELIEKLNRGEISLDEYVTLTKQNTSNTPSIENPISDKEYSDFNKIVSREENSVRRGDDTQQSLFLDNEELESFTSRGIQPVAGGGDFVDARAWRQSNADQIANGVTKFVGKSATAVAGGLAMLPGMVYGLTQGDFTKVYDNDFQKALDNVNASMDEALPNYVTKASEEYGFLKTLGTTNFWANDVTSGLSFVAGALLTEYLSAGIATPFALAKATKYLKNLGYSDDLMKAVNKSIISGKNIKGGDNFLRTGRQMATGAGYEAGVEARHFADEAKNEFLEEFQQVNGREPSEEELAQAMDEIYNTANGLFGINLALVSIGNTVTLPKTFGPGLSKRFGLNNLKDPDSKWIAKVDDLTPKQLERLSKKKNMSIDDLKKEEYVNKFDSYSKTQKVLYNTYKRLEKPIAEGVVEEGLQNTFNGAALDYMDNSLIPESQDEVASISESFMNSLQETYGGKNDGWKEILIGGIIGAIGGPNLGAKKGESKWQGSIFESTSPSKNPNIQKLIDKAKNNKANISNIGYSVESISSMEKQDQALDNNDLFQAKLHEAQDFHAKVGNRLETNTYDDYIEEVEKALAETTDEDFADYYGYENKTKEEIKQRKSEILQSFKTKAQESKRAWELAKQANIINDNSINGGLSFAIFLNEDVRIREGKMAKQLSDLLGVVTDEEAIKEIVPFVEFSKSKEAKTKIDSLQKKTKKLEELTAKELKENQGRTSSAILERGKQLDLLEKEINDLEKQLEKEYDSFIKSKGVSLNYSEDSQKFKKDYELFKFREKQLFEKTGKEILDRPDVDKLFKDLMKVAAYRESQITTANFFFREEGQKLLLDQKKLLSKLRDEDRVNEDLDAAEAALYKAKRESEKAQEAAAEAYRRKSRYMFGYTDFVNQINNPKKIEKDPEEDEDTIEDHSDFLEKNNLSNLTGGVSNTVIFDTIKKYIDYYKGLKTNQGKKDFKENSLQLLKDTLDGIFKDRMMMNSKASIDNVNKIMASPEYKELQSILSEETPVENNSVTPQVIVSNAKRIQTMEWVKGSELSDEVLNIMKTATDLDDEASFLIEQVDDVVEDYAYVNSETKEVLKDYPVKIAIGSPEIKAKFGKTGRVKYVISVMYKGTKIGYFNSPYKYKFGENAENFDPSNIDQLELLNPIFVEINDKGEKVPSRKGIEYINIFKISADNYNELIDKVDESKMSFSNAELKKIFKINLNMSGLEKDSSGTTPTSFSQIKDLYSGKTITTLTGILPTMEGYPDKAIVTVLTSKDKSPKYIITDVNTNESKYVTEQENINSLDFHFSTNNVGEGFNRKVLFKIDDKPTQFIALSENLILENNFDISSNLIGSVQDLIDNLDDYIDKYKVTGDSGLILNSSSLTTSEIRLTTKEGNFQFKLKYVAKPAAGFKIKEPFIEIQIERSGVDKSSISLGYISVATGRSLQGYNSTLEVDLISRKFKYKGKLLNTNNELLKSINEILVNEFDYLKSQKIKKELSAYEKGRYYALKNNFDDNFEPLQNIKRNLNEDEIPENLNNFTAVRTPKLYLQFTKSSGPRVDEFKSALSNINAIGKSKVNEKILKSYLNDLNNSYDKMTSSDKIQNEGQYNDALDKINNLLKKEEPIVEQPVEQPIVTPQPATTSTEEPNVNEDEILFSSSEEESNYFESIEERKSKIIELLPDWINVSEINNFIEGLSTSKYTYGAFNNFVIYLAKNAPQGTEYHEAFHAVFRTMLTNEQVNKVLSEAKSEFGIPTKEQLTDLKNNSPKYNKLTNKQLTDLWYEEKLAEKFRKFMISPTNEKKTFIQKMFDKLKRLIQWLTNSSSYTDDLFNDIANGKFKNSEKKDNTIIPVPAFNLIKAPNDYILKYFDSNTSNNIVTKTFFNVVDFQRTEGYYTDNVIQESIKLVRNTFDPKRYTIILNDLRKTNPSQANSIELRMKAIYDSLTDEENIKYIIEDVNTKLDTYSFIDNTIEAEEGESIVDDTPLELQQKSNQRIGGSESLSRNLKQYISFSTELRDPFGFGYNKTQIQELIASNGYFKDLFENYIDGSKLHNALEVMLINTKRKDIFEKLYYLTKENDSVYFFYKRLLKDIYNDLKLPIPSDYADVPLELSLEQLKKSPYYRMFVSGYTKHKINSIVERYYTGNNTFDMFRANLKDIKDNTVMKWRENLVRTNFFNRKAKDVYNEIDNISKAFKFDSNYVNIGELTSKAKYIKESLKDNFGIDLSLTYVRLSIYDSIKDDVSMLLKDNSELAELDKIHSMYFDLNYLTEDTFKSIRVSIQGNKEDNIIRHHLSKTKADLEKDLGEAQEDVNEDKTGAISTLKDLAEGNSYFDISVVPSTLTNVNKEKVYTHLYPNYITTLALAIRNDLLNYNFIDKSFEEGYEIFANFMKDNDLVSNIDDDTLMIHYRQIRNIPLFNDLDIRDEFIANFEAYTNDGLSSKKDDQSWKSIEYADSYHNLDARGKYIFSLSQFVLHLSDKSSSLSKKITKEGKTKIFNPMTLFQNEGKQTQWSFSVPVQTFINKEGKLNDKAIQYFGNLLNGEALKIREEYKKIINGDLTIVQDYNVLDKGKISKSKFGTEDKLIEVLKDPNHEDFIEATQMFRALKLINFDTLSQTNPEMFKELITNIITEKPITNTNEIFNEFFNKGFQQLLEDLSAPNVQVVIKKEGLYYPKFIPEKYYNGETLNLELLKEYYLNYLFNASSINTLVFGDLTANLKDAVDLFKRYAGPNAAGASIGYGDVNVAIVKDIKLTSELTGNSTNTTDAQSFGSIWWYMNQYLPKDGKWNSEIEKVYEKVLMMEDLDEDDYMLLRDNGSLANPRKTSIFNIMMYGKTSTAILTRKETSYVSKDKLDEFREKIKQLLPSGNLEYGSKEFNEAVADLKKYYKPRPQTKDLHDLLDKMETKSTPIDLLFFESAVKTMKVDVQSINSPSLIPFQINSEYLREQVITDSVKDEIVHGTQLMQLIWSEQLDDDVKLPFNNKEITTKELRNAYKKFLGDRVYMGFEKLYKSIIKNDKANYKFLLESFRASIIEQGGDPIMLEKFSSANGVPVYNLNDPSIVNSFEKMFLSYVSKTVFSKKVAGHKFTLRSDYGHNVIVDNNDNVITRSTFDSDPEKYENYKVRPLSYKKQGNVYYAECKIPMQLLEFIELDERGFINTKFAEMLGIRIPTQDKHSMVYLKVVEILPAELGPQIIMPKEIVDLSGADFDIDSEFARILNSFNSGGTLTSYGSYLEESDSEKAIVNAYNEYINSKKQSKEVRAQLNFENEETEELQILKKDYRSSKDQIKAAKKEDNKETIKKLRKVSKNIKDIIDEITFKNLEKSLKYFDYPSNYTEFVEKYGKQVENNIKYYNEGQLSQIKPITNEEADNYLLDIEKVFVYNTANQNIARTPASRDAATNFIKSFYDVIDSPLKKLGYNTPQAVINAANANAIGQKNIGISALANIMFQYLVQNKTNVENMGVIDSYTIDNERINDWISTVITMATDNAKEQDAIMFNLTPATQGVFTTMLMFKKKFNYVSSLMVQPALLEYSALEAFKSSPLKEKSEEDKGYSTIAKLILNYTPEKGKEPKKLFGDDILEDSFKEQLFKKAKLYKQKLDKGQPLIEGQDLNADEYTAVQFMALTIFGQNKVVTETLFHFSRMISLIKGLNTSIGEGVHNIKDSIEKMGIQVNKVGDKYVINHTLEYILDEKKEDFPIDFKEIIDNDYFLKSELINFYKTSELLPEFFISETKPIKELFDIVDFNTKNLRPEDVNRINKLLVGYLLTKPLKGKSSPYDITSFIGDNETQIVNDLKILKSDPYFGNNAFIRLLDYTKIEYKENERRNFSELNTFSLNIDSFIKLSPNEKMILRDELKMLRLDGSTPEINALAKQFLSKIIIHAYGKDLGIYRNESYIDLIPPALVKSSIHDKLTNIHNEILDGKNMKYIYDIDDNIFNKDFITKFLLDINNNGLIKGNRIDFIYSNINGAISREFSKLSATSKEQLRESLTDEIASGFNKIIAGEKLTKDEMKAIYPIYFNEKEGTIEIDLFKGMYYKTEESSSGSINIYGGKNTEIVRFNKNVIASSGLFKLKLYKKGDKVYSDILAPYVLNISKANYTAMGQVVENIKYQRNLFDNSKLKDTIVQAVYKPTISLGSKQILPYSFDLQSQLDLSKNKPVETTENNKTINVYWGQPESKTSTRILSNLAPRKFIWEGREYGSVEHAYQSNKSGSFDQGNYDKYIKAGGYGTKIRGKGTVVEMKAADSLGLMKQLVVESFKQNPDSEAAQKLLQYENFTHNTNELIDQAFLEGLKLAQKELTSKKETPVEPTESSENTFMNLMSKEIDGISIGVRLTFNNNNIREKLAVKLNLPKPDVTLINGEIQKLLDNNSVEDVEQVIKCSI